MLSEQKIFIVSANNNSSNAEIFVLSVRRKDGHVLRWRNLGFVGFCGSDV